MSRYRTLPASGSAAIARQAQFLAELAVARLRLVADEVERRVAILEIGLGEFGIVGDAGQLDAAQIVGQLALDIDLAIQETGDVGEVLVLAFRR
jgi:hypothetical protein